MTACASQASQLDRIAKRLMQLRDGGAKRLTINQVLGLIAFVCDGEGEASCSPPENEAAQKQLEAVRSLVLRASIGSCSCNTKSPEIIWHDPTCRYVTLMTTLDAIDVLADRVSLVSREESGKHSAPLDPK